eukprot:2804947-Amphidinium_carterae.2
MPQPHTHTENDVSHSGFRRKVPECFSEVGSVRQVRMPSAPWAASSFAMSRPKPLLAPTTRTFFPWQIRVGTRSSVTAHQMSILKSTLTFRCSSQPFQWLVHFKGRQIFIYDVICDGQSPKV